MTTVLVVGDVLADVACRLHGPVAEDSDTPASITLHPGGAGANLASWLATLGVTTTLVGAVGDDRLGRVQLEELELAGVRARLVVVPGAPTGIVVVLVGADGGRSMVTSRGASGRLAPEHLPAPLFGAVDHVHVSGYVLLDPESRPAGLAALALARAAGTTLSVGPGSREPLRRAGAPAFRAWTAGIDILLCNRDEGQALTGLADPDAIARALAADYPEVVLTCGPEGAVWVQQEGGYRREPALPAAVVDTTGAGDAFAAGWLAGWLGGQRGVAALHRGLATAAICVAHAGPRPPRAG